MKYLFYKLAYAFIFFLPYIVSAQEKPYFKEWAPVGAKWEYKTETFSYKGICSVESKKDTLILGKKCKVLVQKYCYYSSIETSISNIYTYADSDKVYVYEKGSFRLLYDFTVKKGDTINIWDSIASVGCNTDGYLKFQVDSVGKIKINSGFLRFYKLKATAINCAGASYIGQYIIEKIGGTSFLFPNNYFYEYTVSPLTLYYDNCMQYTYIPKSNIPLKSLENWQVDASSVCIWTVATNDINIINESIKVYPNPSTDKVSIKKIPKDVNILQLYNTSGQLIKKIEYNDSENYELDVTDLKNDIYILAFYTKTNIYYKKISVMH